MRLVLLADVHANLEALDACLTHARARGADAFAFLGDLVGYGADPAPVVEVIGEAASKGAIVVRGNHDAMVLDARADLLNRGALRAIEWTRGQLGEAHRGFLGSLPLAVRREGALFVHASAEEPEQWLYVTDPMRARRCLEAAAPASWVFGGHVHTPALYHAGPGAPASRFSPLPGVTVKASGRRRWLAIAGSVGQPRDGNTAACYALADLEQGAVTFFRVPYDWDAAARKVLAAGLPESIARRLARGE